MTPRARSRLALAALALAAACPSPDLSRPHAGGARPAAPSATPAGGTGVEHWRRDGRDAVARAREIAPKGPAAQSVILFLGDGMSIDTVVAAHILEGQRQGFTGEENRLVFESFPHVALVKTYNTDQQVGESAGCMTAIMTGVKTRAGVLAMDEGVTPGVYSPDLAAHVVPTLLEQAEERGLSTGVVTTTSVTNATPAACYSHAPDRSWQRDSRLPKKAARAGFPDIARQLVEFAHGDGLEVALGGGRSSFLPPAAKGAAEPGGERADGRDLAREWLARRPRSAYARNAQELAAIDPARTDHLLGLFAFENMRFEADRGGSGEPSLSEMTVAALAILERNPKGYFLMVEGGRIDHGHHLGNAYRALTETIELANAVRAALARVDPKRTLVVVTADHGHTLTIAGYPTRGNPILGKVVENDDRGEPLPDYATDSTGAEYTTLSYANGPGYPGATDTEPEGPKYVSEHPPRVQRGVTEGPPDLRGVDTEAPDYLQAATVPLANESHEGSDVAVYATGPGAALFHGVQEQSYLYYAMAAALGW